MLQARGNHATQCGTNVTHFLTLSAEEVKKARSDRKNGKDKAPAAESKVSNRSSAEPWLWPTRHIDLFKEKAPAVKPPKLAAAKPPAAKPRGKRRKEPVPDAESAAEPSEAGRRLRDKSAEPPADDEAPVSKPSEEKEAAAGPKQRLKPNIKAAVERSLRRKK